METIKERVYLYCAEKNIKIRDFERAADLSNGYISSMRTGFGQGKLNNVLLAFPDLNREWLLYGEGSMLKSATADPNQPTRDNYDTTTAQQPANNQPQKHLIPFYDDVNSRGGLGTYVEDTNTPAQPAEWIDAGDWFHEATAAIRHYGDSMIEYPSGSILALKQVTDLRLIIPGRNYVIETTEFRVTKQLQPHADHLMAYSTNRETYPDGSLIHSPFAIPLETVRTIWQILGCVIKEYSGGAVYIHK